MIVRTAEEHLQNKKNGLSGKEYLVCTHGNRFMEHWILQKFKRYKEFSETVMKDFEAEVKDIIDDIVPKIVEQINTTYSDSYPANIFKNNTKCKEIEKNMLK